MQSVIHQIYCTHCTYGSSALERRQNEMADRVLGYGARAASMPAVELRKSYRDIERFLHYSLPADAPAEEKLRLDAEHAPRRLVYGMAGKTQLLGQISYRKQDTTGRPGSYFGHVLLRDPAAPPWSVVECLQSWGAPWRDSDGPDIAFDLPPLSEVRELFSNARPAIDDGVLRSFLDTPPGGTFDDPRKIIPERWREAPVEERRELVGAVLRGLLQLGANRRESVLLVVEPSVAALVFYGVARLLPAGPVRDELSFSTFESNVDRLTVTLAATCFHSPLTTDVRPEAYRGRGYVNNTFLKKSTTLQGAPSQYLALIMDLLARRDWSTLDRILADFGAASPKRPEDLETLAQAQGKSTTMFTAGSSVVSWREGLETNYLSAALRRMLGEADRETILKMVGSANHLPILQLAAVVPDLGPATKRVQLLALKLPTSQLPAFIDAEQVDPAWKLSPLRSYVRRENRLPPICKSLWTVPPHHGGPSKGGAPAAWLLPLIIAKLSDRRLVEVFKHLSSAQQPIFCQALFAVCGDAPGRKPVWHKLIGLIDDECLFLLLKNQRDELRQMFTRHDKPLNHRLDKLCIDLARNPAQAFARLPLLKDWTEYSSDIQTAEHRLANWTSLRQVLQKLADVQTRPKPGMLQRLAGGGTPEVNEDRVGRDLAIGMNQVMPSEYYPDEDGTEKKKCLRQLGKSLLGTEQFLRDATWGKISRFYGDHNRWPEQMPDYRDNTQFSSSSRGNGLLASARLNEWTTFLILGTACFAIFSGYMIWRMVASSPTPKNAVDNPPIASITAETKQPEQPVMSTRQETGTGVSPPLDATSTTPPTPTSTSTVSATSAVVTTKRPEPSLAEIQIELDDFESKHMDIVRKIAEHGSKFGESSLSLMAINASGIDTAFTPGISDDYVQLHNEARERTVLLGSSRQRIDGYLALADDVNRLTDPQGFVQKRLTHLSKHTSNHGDVSSRANVLKDNLARLTADATELSKYCVDKSAALNELQKTLDAECEKAIAGYQLRYKLLPSPSINVAPFVNFAKDSGSCKMELHTPKTITFAKTLIENGLQIGLAQTKSPVVAFSFKEDGWLTATWLADLRDDSQVVDELRASLLEVHLGGKVFNVALRARQDISEPLTLIFTKNASTKNFVGKASVPASSMPSKIQADQVELRAIRSSDGSQLVAMPEMLSKLDVGSIKLQLDDSSPPNPSQRTIVCEVSPKVASSGTTSLETELRELQAESNKLSSQYKVSQQSFASLDKVLAVKKQHDSDIEKHKAVLRKTQTDLDDMLLSFSVANANSVQNDVNTLLKAVNEVRSNDYVKRLLKELAEKHTTQQFKSLADAVAVPASAIDKMIDVLRKQPDITVPAHEITAAVIQDKTQHSLKLHEYAVSAVSDVQKRHKLLTACVALRIGIVNASIREAETGNKLVDDEVVKLLNGTRFFVTLFHDAGGKRVDDVVIGTPLVVTAQPSSGATIESKDQ